MRFRALIILFFCLPASFIFQTFRTLKPKIKLILASKTQHEDKVNAILKHFECWRKTSSPDSKKICTNRKNWMSLSTRFFNKKVYSQVPIDDLNTILELDTEQMIVKTEPMVTIGEMVNYLFKEGYTLAVALEIKEATLGGLAMGVGMTTHSHKVGLFQESIVAYEVLLPSGQRLRATENNYRDLFRTLPWSHGTLGIIIALEIRIIPVKKFIRLTYTPCHSQIEYCEKIRALAIDPKGSDFLEATIFTPNQAVIMQGWFDDNDEKKPVTHINRFWKPWFFKHVEEFLHKGCATEIIPFTDYIFRHNRSLFWTLQDMLPAGNHPLMRLFFGWMYPPNIAFLKLSTPKALRVFTFKKQVFQDIILPLTSLKRAIDLSHELFCIYPLLVYPCRIYDHGMDSGQLRPPRDIDRINGTNFGMYCDFGIYGIPQAVKDNKPYNGTEAMRAMEAFIIEEKGYSFLYADTFLTRDEFSKMFDLTLYDRVRKKYQLEYSFPHLYNKTRPEIDVISLGQI